MPPFVPHQEINASPTETLECVLVRSDGEAVAVNLDIEPGEFFFGQRGRFGRKPDQSFDKVMAGIGIKRRLDPRKALLGSDLACLCFHLRRREIFEQGDINFPDLLTQLLLLGDAAPQIRAFALEEENEMFAPAYRFPDDPPDPVIPARDASTTDPTAGEALDARLAREKAEATAQILPVLMLHGGADRTAPLAGAQALATARST